MGVAIIAVVLAIAVLAIMTFNQLTHLKQLADNAWSDIDVQLKRRHDLIPTVVDVVKGQTGYERSTLEAVVSARNRALDARGPAAKGEAETVVEGSLHRVLALAEAYPDLKAGDAFLALQRTLADVENHLQSARRYYNAVVRDFNTKIGQFPSNLVAGVGGFKPREFFGLDDPGESAVPDVAFGPNS